MGEISKGKYWDKAWSLVEGCTPVSEACDNCWLADMAYRFNPELCKKDSLGFIKHGFSGKVNIRRDRLDIPLRTRKPTVFAVWSDLFHEEVPFRFIMEVLANMYMADQHTFVVLTKRPGRMAKILQSESDALGKIPSNIFFGVTAENQQRLDERLPYLLQVPGKKILSIEPMLGLIDLTSVKHFEDDVEWSINALTGEAFCVDSLSQDAYCPDIDGISGVICGGETGPGVRPLHPDWVRSLRDQCQAAGIPFFFKQWGEYLTIPECGERGYKFPMTDVMNANSIGNGFMRVGRKKAGRLLDGREWNELLWMPTGGENA